MGCKVSCLQEQWLGAAGSSKLTMHCIDSGAIMPMHVTGHHTSLFTSMCATYESAGGLNMGGTPDPAPDHRDELPLSASGRSV